MTDAQTSHEGRRIKVFLSYSRKDTAFLYRLAGDLEARGHTAVFDQSDRPHHDDPDLALSAQDEWWLQLKRMIAASDVMVFIVTPESARSRICDDEIAHARLLGKRIIAILRRAIDFDSAPARLRALNIKLDFASDDEAFQKAACDQLMQEIELDIEWHRQGARLVRLAQQWSSAGCPKGDLLRAGAIADAETWLAQRPANAPGPGAIVLEYLDASRALELADRDTLLQGVANGFAVRADKAASERRMEHAAKCVGAAAVLAEDDDFSPQRAEHAWRLGARALFDANHVVLEGHVDSILDAQWSIDGRLIATASKDGTCRLWDTTAGQQLHVLEGRGPVVRACRFLADGNTIVTTGDDGFIRLWQIGTGKCSRAWGPYADRVMAIACARDGTWIASGGSDTTILIIDVATGNNRLVLAGHSQEIVALDVCVLPARVHEFLRGSG